MGLEGERRAGFRVELVGSGLGYRAFPGAGAALAAQKLAIGLRLVEQHWTWASTVPQKIAWSS